MKILIYHCPDAPTDIQFMAIAQREKHLFHVQPGASVEDAETRLTTSLARIEARFAKTGKKGSPAAKTSEEGFAQLVGTTYWWHPESDSYFALEDGDQHPAARSDADGCLCVELSADEYAARAPKTNDLDDLFA